ncbi:ATP-binding protein [Stappia sp.]|uniref:sensor histidine kinase n=1 Tax=Stappia sp. TaxID=1870903 RepID=UPI003A9A28BE
MPSATHADAARTLRIEQGLFEKSIEGHMSLLRDTAHDLSFADVAFGPARDSFTALPDKLALGYTKDPIWIRLTLERDGVWPEALFMILSPTYLDRVDIYLAQSGAPRSPDDFRHEMAGDHVADGDKGIPLPYIATKLQFPATDRFDVYLRIKTTSTMSLRGALVSPEALASLSMWRAVKLASLCAVMFAFALINFFYWIYLRKPLFLSFFCFLLADMLSGLTDSGLLPRMFAIGDQYAIDILTGWAVILVVLTSLYFTRYQLETRRNFPLGDKLLKLLAPVIAATLVASLAGFYQTVIGPVILVAILLAGFLFFGNVLLLLRRRRLDIVLATAASFVYFCGITLAAGRLFGILGLNMFTEHSYQSLSIIFVILMSLSLVQRARVADIRRREGASLRIARKAEYAARSLVKIRTAELEAAKQEAEAALASERAAQAEQIRFVDVITHQYQTPLAVIRSSVSAIFHTLPPGDDANRGRIGRIQSAIRALVEVLDVSLHRSRVAGITVKPECRLLPVGSTLETIVERSRDLISDQRIHLDTSGLPPATHAWFDANMLGIALTNLLDNAAKFSPADKAVHVRASIDDAHLTVTVTDQGIGIPANELQHLAKRYFRASNTGEIHGSGLGLHIVDAVARAHGGRFRVRNGATCGVVATLVLPLDGRMQERVAEDARAIA